jgi:hypothetical protein
MSLRSPANKKECLALIIAASMLEIFLMTSIKMKSDANSWRLPLIHQQGKDIYGIHFTTFRRNTDLTTGSNETFGGATVLLVVIPLALNITYDKFVPYPNMYYIVD